ncbi:MAG TPA: M24 family metallopeptidase [Gaiellaceae bacterium]|nr:M24 family metallopeptidase [Gaiellaceae bacterium]
MATGPATVRWLLCGRGRPVDAASPQADYVVVLTRSGGFVLHPDIEASRVESEERFEELGYEPVAYPWHAGPETAVAEMLAGSQAVADAEAEDRLAPHRRLLVEAERERLRAAGADCAAAVEAALARLGPQVSELDAAGELAYRTRGRGFFPKVVLVACDRRQKVHRHPLPTPAPLGAHALLAVTAEREGLHVSLTRIVAFGRPPGELARLVRLAAEVDAVMLEASRPGVALGEILLAADRAYAARGFPGEWRRHHQGGLTGYRGREVFATPDEPTELPRSCAVAWNPSVTGGAKSEDTALVSADGVEVVTRTPSLAELDVGGLRRPGIVTL